MTEYDWIFVVLVYGNPKDLLCFLDSLDKLEIHYRAVVVNSFFDDKTFSQVRECCHLRGCDFLPVENKGYGCGNNAGIAHALDHYRFRFLAVCNPDVEVRSLPQNLDAPRGVCVFGPEIKTLTGKRQNPCMPFASPLRERLLRAYAAHPRLLLFFYAAIALNKAERLLFLLFFRGRVRNVYALHGSFLAFTLGALERMGRPFDPRMFLFREEDSVARLARSLHIPMIYDPRIKILHKEDGSVKLRNVNVRKNTVESLKVYFGLKNG